MSSLAPFLYTGVILPTFKGSGNIPLLMQLLKILASMGDNTDLQCFKTTMGMSLALSLDNSQIISEISLTVMSSKNIDDSSDFGRNLKKLL